jgi:hypothetical protein
VTDPHEPGGRTRWIHHVASRAEDRAAGVGVDARGGARLAGTTDGCLAVPCAGADDVFVRALDDAGAELWTVQLGSPARDVARAVTVLADGRAGVAGDTDGDVAGAARGGGDAFVVLLDPAGRPLWADQFGTPEHDVARAVAADGAGALVVAGDTSGDLGGVAAGGRDAFVRAYRPDGRVRWTRQFGGGGADLAYGVAVAPDGDVLVVGTTSATLAPAGRGATDAYLRRYDASGRVLWTRRFGTDADERGAAVASDAASGAVVAGYTVGALAGPAAGGGDAFVRSYDARGNVRWTRQDGSPAFDAARAVAVTPTGDVVVAGVRENGTGAVAGALVRSYDARGTLRWETVLGAGNGPKVAADEALGVAVDAAGVRIVGTTRGDLRGDAPSDADVFAALLTP